MPPRVYRGRYGYELHPKSGGSKTIAKLDATEAHVWTAYRNAVGGGARNVTWLANKYMASSNFLKLKPKTKSGYLECWSRLRPVFGQVEAQGVQQHHIRRYMDKRGLTSESRANKEKKFFSNIFAYGFERGLVLVNPCLCVKLFPEKARDFYVPDSEYYDLLEASQPIVQVFMELSYINAARGQDVRKIALNDLREEGLFIQQAKTGKKQIKKWNPRLRAAINLAKKLRSERLKKKVECMYLVVTSTGGPYSDSGLKSLWRKARDDYQANTGKKIEWTFHDIKAKSISDYEGDKQEFSSHKSREMMERYNRSVDTVEVIDFPK